MKRALIFFSMIALSGCAPTKELRRPAANRSAQEVIDAVNAHRHDVTTLEAKGSISAETPSFANSGSFELRLKKPDSILVDIEGPFGIHVASALFAKDHYIFYNSFKNEVIEGDVDKGNLPAFMNIRIDPADVVDMFCGTRTFLPEEASPDSFTIGDDSYVLFFRHNNGATRYIVDGQVLLITGIEHIDSAGEVWSEERFEYDRRDDGTIVPQTVRLSQYTLQTSVSLEYDDIHINVPLGPMTLHIPPDARRVTKE
ncbi:MAG: DUF4292 domain-containing protein [Bacteroidota bacterium]